MILMYDFTANRIPNKILNICDIGSPCTFCHIIYTLSHAYPIMFFFCHWISIIISPLQDLVTWYGINYTEMQMTQ